MIIGYCQKKFLVDPSSAPYSHPLIQNDKIIEAWTILPAAKNLFYAIDSHQKVPSDNIRYDFNDFIHVQALDMNDNRSKRVTFDE